MSRFRLYCGLAREGRFYNYTEVVPLEGGVLAMLDGAEKSGAARLLNLMKGSIKSLYTEDGEEFVLNPSDYEDLRVMDTWKIGYEQIKLKTGEEYPIIPENFYCNRCSKPKNEHYTSVNESWQKLIEDGFIDEIYLDGPDYTFEVVLPNSIVIQPERTFAGGTYDTLIMQHLTLGEMIKIHRSSEAMASDANLIRATWDASIVGIKRMSEREFNMLKRNPVNSISKKYLNTQENQDAVDAAIEEHLVGIDAKDRIIYCSNCGNEIREGLDYTNFFSPLLPKKSSRNR
jgi:hypothetical protein